MFVLTKYFFSRCWQSHAPQQFWLEQTKELRKHARTSLRLGVDRALQESIPSARKVTNLIKLSLFPFGVKARFFPNILFRTIEPIRFHVSGGCHTSSIARGGAAFNHKTIMHIFHHVYTYSQAI